MGVRPEPQLPAYVHTGAINLTVVWGMNLPQATTYPQRGAPDCEPMVFRGVRTEKGQVKNTQVAIF